MIERLSNRISLLFGGSFMKRKGSVNNGDFDASAAEE
jgi:hypothetical protein